MAIDHEVVGRAPARALWALLACATTLVGCGGASATSICDEICDCEGCSETESDECIDNIEDAERRAESDGCEEEFDALTECIDSQIECRDDRVDADGCEPEAEDLAKCGDGVFVGFGNLCDSAAEICGGGTGGNEEVQCTGATRCAAQCIVDQSSCDISASPELQQCISGCSG
jgi:hypothetical protein